MSFPTENVIDNAAIDTVDSGGVNEGVNEGVNKLFKVIEESPGKRVPYYALVLDIPEKTIERWIKDLRENNRIEFRGAPKTGGYYLKNSEN